MGDYLFKKKLLKLIVLSSKQSRDYVTHHRKDLKKIKLLLFILNYSPTSIHYNDGGYWLNIKQSGNTHLL